MDTTPALCSGGHGFQFSPDHQLLTEDLHGFPQYLQASSGIQSQIMTWQLSSTSFPIHYLLITASLHATSNLEVLAVLTTCYIKHKWRKHTQKVTTNCSLLTVSSRVTGSLQIIKRTSQSQSGTCRKLNTLFFGLYELGFVGFLQFIINLSTCESFSDI
jgi:hypothetical protein